MAGGDPLKCVKDCPAGTYKNLLDRTCSPCAPACTSCKDKLASTCSECAANFFLSGEICLAACPPGEVKKTVPNRCVKCNEKCSECAGVESNCTKCAGTYSWDSASSTCVTKCPDGTFSDPNR